LWCAPAMQATNCSASDRGAFAWQTVTPVRGARHSCLVRYW
jgi:hypothetical protein